MSHDAAHDMKIVTTDVKMITTMMMDVKIVTMMMMMKSKRSRLWMKMLHSGNQSLTTTRA